MMNRLLPLCASAFAATVVSGAALAASAVPIDPFHSIELKGGGHVTLRHGAAQRVTVMNGSTQFTRFRVEHDGKLVIDACNENCPHHYDLEVEIVTPRIDGVAISGGGKIESESGFGRQDSIGVAVEGGGHIDVRSIDTERADAAVNGGGNISYWGNPSVTSAVDGGGSINKGE